MTCETRTGELCIGSARLPAEIVELAAEGALLRAAITRQAFEAQALKINGVGYLPVNAYKWLEDGLLMVAFDKPSAKVRRKLRQMLAGSDLDLAGPALAYLARH
ncbi:MAG: hypothetical protein Tsb0016_08100 [Sphingomonadales bacterium]